MVLRVGKAPKDANHLTDEEGITSNPFTGQNQHHHLCIGAIRPPQAALP